MKAFAARHGRPPTPATSLRVQALPRPSFLKRDIVFRLAIESAGAQAKQFFARGNHE